MTCEQVVELPDSDLLAMTTEINQACVCPAHGHHEQAEPTWLQRQLLGAITLYQRVRDGRPSPCRFFPSCSAYALESVAVHGAWRGGWLSFRRLLRCRPLGPSGVDLVPARPSPTVSCECHGADAPALLTPTVVSSTQKKGG
jgi:putative membrane protein insertion efficiency factor